MQPLPEARRRAADLRAALGALAAGLALLAAARAPAAQLEPFEANYNWIWNGMTVASTTVQLEKTGDTWTYTSRSEPRGIGKLMSQRPRTVSVLRQSAGGIEPLTYKGDDGTSSDKRSIDLKYDWTRHRVTGVYEQTPVDLPLSGDVQDDSSVQVALMAALLGGRTPDHFSVIDKNSVREYRYQRDGTETVKTPFGDIAAVIYSSSHANSPRVNRYWCAPERGFIPLRVQQRRGDEVEWTMEIQTLRRQ